MRSKAIVALPVLIFLTACDSGILEEEVFSQLGPTNFFQGEQDALALLAGAYSIEQEFDHPFRDYVFHEVPTDIQIQRRGGNRRHMQPIEDFNWNASHAWMPNNFQDKYRAIYAANLILDEVPEMGVRAEVEQLIVAEARFIRAESYMMLYEMYGTVPLITASEVDPDALPARAPNEELIQFVETELRAASDVLPLVHQDYGRATRGAALGLLARFHLDNKKWQQAADVAKEVIDLGIYALFRGSHRSDLFRVPNERNSEFIYVRPYVTNVEGNIHFEAVVPFDYQFKSPPKQNFASDYLLLEDFVDSFHPDDERRDMIMFEYINTSGVLKKFGENDKRSQKFAEDLQATGTRNSGNDFPILRYAEILMIRAEALNELRGPNAESIDLINRVRAAAGMPPISVADFPSKDALRAHILQELAWEFFNEGHRRRDLIRHGKFIEFAQQRGKPAQPFHVLYPIPQTEIDRNPTLEQNPGY